MHDHTEIDVARHPCFNAGAKGRYGRIHLPVAPSCNIKCNYCDRRHDCVNESRPGVSSAVLAPHQALAYAERVLAEHPYISVAGIAGPGDPFANPDQTLGALRLIRERFPEMILCLATNGLALAPHLDELAALKVSHVTLTVNAVDPEVGGWVYAWARDGKVIHRGRGAAGLLWERQREGILGLKQRGITVKVNTIVIPGVNDAHVPAVAETVAGLGADLLNLMPMHPNPGTPLFEKGEPSAEVLERLRAAAQTHLPQMRHCTRCRADAVGLLGEDRSGELAGLMAGCANLARPGARERPYVAVASREGILVNLHLGQAERLAVWERHAGGFRLVEERPAPPPGGGQERWRALAELLEDCRAVLAGAAGETPRLVLEDRGITVVEMDGLIEHGLKAIYGGDDVGRLAKRRAGAGCCGGGGPGGGCC